MAGDLKYRVKAEMRLVLTFVATYSGYALNGTPGHELVDLYFI